MISQKTNSKLKDVATSGRYFTVTSAQAMIQRYQEQEPDGVRSFMYGRHMFELLLHAPQCAGIRIFNGLDEKSDQTLVFTAADAAGEHITDCELQTANGPAAFGDPITGGGTYCPYDCPKGGEGLEIYIREMYYREPSDLTSAGVLIPRKKAQEMIQAYQAAEPDGMYSMLLGREAFEAILQVPGCAGIRVFNAINDEGLHIFILAPINAQGANILKYPATTVAGPHMIDAPLTTGTTFCPFDCPKAWEWLSE